MCICLINMTKYFLEPIVNINQAAKDYPGYTVTRGLGGYILTPGADLFKAVPDSHSYEKEDGSTITMVPLIPWKSSKITNFGVPDNTKHKWAYYNVTGQEAYILQQWANAGYPTNLLTERYGVDRYLDQEQRNGAIPKMYTSMSDVEIDGVSVKVNPVHVTLPRINDMGVDWSPTTKDVWLNCDPRYEIDVGYKRDFQPGAPWLAKWKWKGDWYFSYITDYGNVERNNEIRAKVQQNIPGEWWDVTKEYFVEPTATKSLLDEHFLKWRSKIGKGGLLVRGAPKAGGVQTSKSRPMRDWQKSKITSFGKAITDKIYWISEYMSPQEAIAIQNWSNTGLPKNMGEIFKSPNLLENPRIKYEDIPPAFTNVWHVEVDGYKVGLEKPHVTPPINIDNRVVWAPTEIYLNCHPDYDLEPGFKRDFQPGAPWFAKWRSADNTWEFAYGISADLDSVPSVIEIVPVHQFESYEDATFVDNASMASNLTDTSISLFDVNPPSSLMTSDDSIEQMRGAESFAAPSISSTMLQNEQTGEQIIDGTNLSSISVEEDDSDAESIDYPDDAAELDSGDEAPDVVPNEPGTRPADMSFDYGTTKDDLIDESLYTAPELQHFSLADFMSPTDIWRIVARALASGYRDTKNMYLVPDKVLEMVADWAALAAENDISAEARSLGDEMMRYAEYRNV